VSDRELKRASVKKTHSACTEIEKNTAHALRPMSVHGHGLKGRSLCGKKRVLFSGIEPHLSADSHGMQGIGNGGFCSSQHASMSKKRSIYKS
jgi:hypothetical protein